MPTERKKNWRFDTRGRERRVPRLAACLDLRRGVCGDPGENVAFYRKYDVSLGALLAVFALLLWALVQGRGERNADMGRRGTGWAPREHRLVSSGEDATGGDRDARGAAQAAASAEAHGRPGTAREQVADITSPKSSPSSRARGGMSNGCVGSQAMGRPWVPHYFPPAAAGEAFSGSSDSRIRHLTRRAAKPNACRGLCPRTPRIYRSGAAAAPAAMLPQGVPPWPLAARGTLRWRECDKSQGVWGTGPPGPPRRSTLQSDEPLFLLGFRGRRLVSGRSVSLGKVFFFHGTLGGVCEGVDSVGERRKAPGWRGARTYAVPAMGELV